MQTNSQSQETKIARGSMTPEELRRTVCSMKLPFIRKVLKEIESLQVGESLSLEGKKFKDEYVLVGKFAIQYGMVTGKDFELLFLNDYSAIRKFRVSDGVTIYKKESKRA